MVGQSREVQDSFSTEPTFMAGRASSAAKAEAGAPTMTRAASRASAFVWIALSLVWLAGLEGESSEEEMEGKRWATPRRIATKSHRY